METNPSGVQQGGDTDDSRTGVASLASRPTSMGASPAMAARHQRENAWTSLGQSSGSRGEPVMGNTGSKRDPEMKEETTVEVQKKRATFSEAKKKQLRQMGRQYGMLFLARLRVITKEVVQFFNCLEKVWRWIDTHPSSGKDTDSGNNLQQQHSCPRHELHHRPSAPSKREVQQERQKVVEAVASLSSPDLSPTPTIGEEMDQSGSDQDSVITRTYEEAG
ncbi:hypothetical protein NDU88_002724 [Pleurodeles waltl]|uniref:Uncharacterized protein n=1 Tax=Pleurodeles waltl TaxID=8319 RepID=A0AAV7MNH7_PLEWA|nr:hypothetical protein NDU88_002724 [Pleurodeles waltl]